MDYNVNASLTLSFEELKFLEESLQRDAVGLLRSFDSNAAARASDVYKANRALFRKVWESLYD